MISRDLLVNCIDSHAATLSPPAKTLLNNSRLKTLGDRVLHTHKHQHANIDAQSKHAILMMIMMMTTLVCVGICSSIGRKCEAP